MEVIDPTVRALQQEALEDPDGFWAGAADELPWFQRWDRVLEWSAPSFRWFVGARTNLAHNCLDRHVKGGRAGHAALVAYSERGDRQVLTYAQLLHAVEQTAAALGGMGIGKGDRIAIYMPTCVEAIVLMLACVRIGAIHLVVFAGFGAGALADRIRLAGAKALFTADVTWRKGREVDLKAIAAAAMDSGCPAVERVVVLRRSDGVPPTGWLDWHDFLWQRISDQTVYFSGDAASFDEDGYVWFSGRADEIIKIAAHRVGTIEVETAFLRHPAVAEVGVCGRADQLRGEVISAFVSLKEGQEPSNELRAELVDTVRRELGPVAVIGELSFVSVLPKTRSGKIMRRVLRAVATGTDPGDISTIEDEGSVGEARESWQRMQEEVAAQRANS